MSLPNALVGRQRDQLLADAIHEKARLVLSYRGADQWQLHKSRLLDMAPARRALVVAYPYDIEDDEIEFDRGEQLGVSFRHRSRKCMFGATVVGKRQPRRRTTRGFSSKAILISWPEQIEELQRRVYYRVDIPDFVHLDVEFWPGGADVDGMGPPAGQETQRGRLLDLSVGGMRVEVPSKSNPRFEENTLVGARFSPDPKQPPLVLEACFRHVQVEGVGKLSLGFQFVGLELASDGRSLLSRLATAVSRLQRGDGRRHP